MSTTGTRAALAVALLACAAPAHAEDFALTCIGTQTGYSINFEYRWGEDDEWTSTTVAPGQWHLLGYHYKVPGRHQSPQLQVRYDDDLTDGVHPVVTSIRSYAAYSQDCEGEGWRYNFFERDNELFIRNEEG